MNESVVEYAIHIISINQYSIIQCQLYNQSEESVRLCMNAYNCTKVYISPIRPFQVMQSTF